MIDWHSSKTDKLSSEYYIKHAIISVVLFLKTFGTAQLIRHLDLTISKNNLRYALAFI